MGAAGPDLIRLSLPADQGLAPVVEVATAVLARRAGLSDTEVATARSAVGDEFRALSGTTGTDRVDVTVEVWPHRLEVRLDRGGVERTVPVPDLGSPSGRHRPVEPKP